MVHFEDGSNPSHVLTGPQKVAGVACVLLLQALFAGVCFIIVMGESDSLHAASTSLMVAVVASALARPGLPLIDGIFKRFTGVWKTRLELKFPKDARFSVKRRQHWKERLYAGAALDYGLTLLDLQVALSTWRDALIELQVSPPFSIRNTLLFLYW